MTPPGPTWPSAWSTTLSTTSSSSPPPPPPPHTEGGLLPLITSLVSVREGGQGTAVSCVQEKTDHLQNLLDLLKAADCSKDTKEPRGQGRKELETLLCAEPGSGAPGCQQRGGVAGGAVPPVHLQAWREEEQEREEGTVQDWPGQSLRGWTWCWYRLGERSTPSSLSCP